MGRLDSGMTFCAEPFLDDCLTKIRLLSKLKERPAHSQDGSSLVAICICVFCTHEHVKSGKPWFVCLDTILSWSVADDFAESLLCVCSDYYYWDIIIDVGIIRPFGIQLP